MILKPLQEFRDQYLQLVKIAQHIFDTFDTCLLFNNSKSIPITMASNQCENCGKVVASSKFYRNTNGVCQSYVLCLKVYKWFSITFLIINASAIPIFEMSNTSANTCLGIP